MALVPGCKTIQEGILTRKFVIQMLWTEMMGTCQTTLRTPRFEDLYRDRADKKRWELTTEHWDENLIEVPLQ
jgi:hypothetical protein